MGDVTIAEQAREGLRGAIDTVGEEVRILRYMQGAIPGRATGRSARPITDPNAPGDTDGLPRVNAIISDFDRKLIDGDAIRVGDRELTMLAVDGPSDGPFSFLASGNRNNWPPLRIGDGVHVAGRTMTVVSTNTTRVSGKDVSISAVLR